MISLPSSLAAAPFSDRSSQLPLPTWHQAIDPASNPLDPVPHHCGAQGPSNPAVSQLLMFKKPHLGISGGLFCDLSSLFTGCWSVHRSHFALVPSNFASGHPSRFQSLCSLPSSLFFLCSLPSLLAAVAVGCRMPLLLLRCLLPDRFSLFSALFPLLSEGLTLFSTIPPFWNRTVAFFGLGAPVTSNFESSHRIRFQLHPPVRHHPWPGGVREAIK